MRERLWFSVASAAGIAGLDVCCLHVEQLTRPRDVVGAPAVREEGVVADAMEAARQDVDQKATDELVAGSLNLRSGAPAPRSQDRKVFQAVVPSGRHELAAVDRPACSLFEIVRSPVPYHG
jgi:hypothetical protein